TGPGSGTPWSAGQGCRPVTVKGALAVPGGDRERPPCPWTEAAEMTVHPAHWRYAGLAAACCATLAALTLAAPGASGAQAATAAAAWGSGTTPIVITSDGAVRGTTAGAVDEFLGVPYAAPPTGHLRWRP